MNVQVNNMSIAEISALAQSIPGLRRARATQRRPWLRRAREIDKDAVGYLVASILWPWDPVGKACICHQLGYWLPRCVVVFSYQEEPVRHEIFVQASKHQGRSLCAAVV